MRRNGATCGAAATATPSRDAQATTSQSAHGHNRSRSTGKMHGLFFHRLTAFKPALFLAQGVARRADLFWFRDDVVSRCCMARVVAFDSESVLCRVRSLCITRAHADRVRSSFFTRRIASCGNDRTTSPSGLPRRQPGNSKLHFASTRVRYARNPASSPSSPANSAWRPLFASLWRPSRPVLTARGPCVSPPTIALSPGSTRAAARDGRRLRVRGEGTGGANSCFFALTASHPPQAHRRCCYPVAGRPLARVGEAGRPRPFAGRCL